MVKFVVAQMHILTRSFDWPLDWSLSWSIDSLTWLVSWLVCFFSCGHKLYKRLCPCVGPSVRWWRSSWKRKKRVHFFFYKNVIFFSRLHVFILKAKWSLQRSQSVLNLKYYINYKEPYKILLFDYIKYISFEYY